MMYAVEERESFKERRARLERQRNKKWRQNRPKKRQSPVYGPKEETQAAYWVRIKHESMEQHPIYDQDKINALLAAGVLEHHERK